MQKKFILFIVEGNNDKKEITAMLHSQYFAQYKNKYQFEFYDLRGDITSKEGITDKNIQGKLNSIFLDWRERGIPFNRIKPCDVQEIVHIIDMDGVFIPKEDIEYGDVGRFYYEEKRILSYNPSNAIGRNNKKSKIIKKLLTVSQIDGVPYSIYFLSCNMDHVLFDERNPSQQYKDNKARSFPLLCLKTDILQKTIFSPSIAAQNTYEESWGDIQDNHKSLGRYTNFNLFFGDKAKNPK
ncbi:MAG: hypothetical protein IJJ85_03055 [Clostridia bacterium]|nr:hypothetical protein [Clostridia bacterium]